MLKWSELARYNGSSCKPKKVATRLDYVTPMDGPALVGELEPIWFDIKKKNQECSDTM